MFSRGRIKGESHLLKAKSLGLCAALFLASSFGLLSVISAGKRQIKRAEASVLTDSSQNAGNSLAASVSVRVQVPSSMKTAPFNVERYLTVPPNFAVSVYARVPSARFMAVAPNGDLLVSQPRFGEVKIIRSNGAGDPAVSTFASGLRNPHDIVFHTVGATTYVYIAESNQINRYVYNAGDLTAQNRQIVVANLPDASSQELGGFYGHQLKNIALDANNKLYVAIASATNSSISDAFSDPVRCAIYQYNADGTSGRLFARGLRNAEGLAMLPGANELWVVVNNRDNIAYPFHNDWDGDGTDDYGKVMQSYVDNHPPDEFTRVRDGGNYGFPFVNPNPDAGMNDMPFDLDVENNPDGRYGTVNSFDRITKGIEAHTAPLGFSFTTGTAFPAAYKPGAVVALHGSWNRSTRVGYKVIYFPWNTATQTPGSEMNLVAGWATGNDYWGRPVDAVVDLQGNLLISDDYAGAIYKLTYTDSQPSVAPESPSNLTAAAVSPNQLNLAWTDNSQNEDGFKVEQSSLYGGIFKEIGMVGAGVTNFSVAGLTANRNYYYRVRAFNAVGASGYSNSVRKKTPKR